MLGFLSDQDKKILNNLIAKQRDLENRTQGNLIEEEEVQQPNEIYLARIPTGETLSGLSSGNPGTLECDIYRPGGDDGSSTPVSMGFKHWVLNFTDPDITEDLYVPVMRDKYGFFVVAVGSGATNVCTKLKEFPVGTYDKDTVNLIGLRTVPGEGEDPDTEVCEQFAVSISGVCEALKEFTTRTLTDEVLMVGVKPDTDPDEEIDNSECGLYDIMQEIADLKECICILTSALSALAEATDNSDTPLCS